MEEHGYTSFKNKYGDLDLFLHALNESSNKFDFDSHFSESKD